MLKNKRALILLCGLMLLPLPASAADSSDSLISNAMIQAETANYDTYVVEPLAYERSYTSSAKEYYPHSYNLRYEGDEAKFVEYLVKRGDEVKVGDVLARFTLETDEISLASHRLSLQNAKISLEKEKEAREQKIIDLDEAMMLETDRYQKELLALQKAYQEVSLAQYVYQQEINIASIEEKIAEILETQHYSELISPVDGVITSLTYKQEGARVFKNEMLVELYRKDDMLLRVDNSNDYFRYGMDVIVTVRSGSTRTELTGRVVGADTLIPAKKRTKYAFVKLDPYDEKNINLRNPQVQAPTIHLDNAILIPRKGLTLEAGKYYVTKLEDGMTKKRYVNYVATNTTYSWILQGLEFGETIIID